jgi:hypothetical protein
VRNFGILKMALDLPTRLDQCTTGPFDVNLIDRAIKAMIGKSTIIKKKLSQ